MQNALRGSRLSRRLAADRMKPRRIHSLPGWLGLLLWLVMAGMGRAVTEPASAQLVTTEVAAVATPSQSVRYLYTGEQIDPDLGMYYLRARYYQPGIGRFWNMDSYEGRQSEPQSLHKYLYCHGNPVNGSDPSGHDLVGSLSTASIQSGLISISIAAPLRGMQAAAQVRAGADLNAAYSEYAFGLLTDGLIGAALPGLSKYIGSGIAALRGSQALVRATDSVWKLGAFARGWAIESQILGGTRRLVQNFPVIDDLVNGVATSIKSIDLTAATYRTAANLAQRLEGYAGSLSRFTGGSASYAGQVSVVTANQIEQRVLVVAVEDGAATVAQMQTINDFINKAKLLWPNIKVLVVPVP